MNPLKWEVQSLLVYLIFIQIQTKVNLKLKG